jgi:carboxyl-terminal processing protease
MAEEKQKKSFSWFKFISYYLLIIFITAGYVAGFYFGKVEAQKVVDAQIRVPVDKFVSGEVENKKDLPKFLTKDVKFDLYWDVWQRLKENYVEKPVSETEMFYGSLKGLVASVGDPHTVFFDPEIAFKFQQELDGSFEGIGAELGIKKDILTIVSPLPDTPAEKAGLRPGDQIYYIDQTESSAMSLEEAVSLIRGQKGTQVVLKIWRVNHTDKLIEIPIIRDEIKVVSASWSKIDNSLAKEKGKKIAHIKIRQFNEDTTSSLEKIGKEMADEKIDSIILDLRNNPGGLLDQSIKVSGMWAGKGVMVKEKRQTGKNFEYLSDSNPIFKNIKTVVLINEGSASASEIVAGALQDYGLATIIGKKSFGKGSVQDYQVLKDGSALKVTVAKWLTPKDRSIDGEGILPDIEVELKSEDYNENRDPQLDEAVKVVLQQ